MQAVSALKSRHRRKVLAAQKDASSVVFEPKHGFDPKQNNTIIIKN